MRSSCNNSSLPPRGSRTRRLILSLMCSTLLVACREIPDPPVRDLTPESDASVADLGRYDASQTDAGGRDSGSPDGSTVDSGVPDASVPDASVPDASVPDASIPDASIPDASVPDASVPDASIPDASVPDASVPDGAVGSTDFAGASPRLRIMAGNITSGNKQSYDPGEGIRIFQGLKPDIALIQEFNYGDNSATAVRGFVNTAFGSAYSYWRESGAQIPNGVVSRYPIIAAGNWVDPKVSNRSFVWAHIDLPGPQDLWAVSVHLLTSSAANRNAEATALLAELAKVVTPGEYIVVGGDFNTDTRTEAVVSTFGSILNAAAPYPADAAGNGNTNASRAKPYDWVLASPNLSMLMTPVVIGTHSFTSGLVVDSRVYTPLSEIAPVLVGDSGAINMQHMAVVKDFLLF